MSKKRNKNKARKIKYKYQFCKRKIRVNVFGKIDYKDITLDKCRISPLLLEEKETDCYLNLNNYLKDFLEDLKADYISAINKINNKEHRIKLIKEFNNLGYYSFKKKFVNYINNKLNENK